MGSTPIDCGYIKYKDGSVYNGALRNLKPHGKGNLKMPNGEIKCGQWRRGEFNKCDSAGSSVDKPNAKRSQIDNLVSMIRE